LIFSFSIEGWRRESIWIRIEDHRGVIAIFAKRERRLGFEGRVSV